MLSASTDTAFEEGRTSLTMVQRGIFDAKIKKLVDREEILEDNLKRAFTILQGQCTESLIDKLEGNSKYEFIESNQDVIGMMKVIKGVMLKFNGNS